MAKKQEMAKKLSVIKLFKNGWNYLWRQGFLSFATALVIFITVVLGTVLIIGNGGIGFMTDKIKDKMDISIYFNDQISRDKILEIREEVIKLPEVKKADYVSSEEAYTNFSNEHQDDSYAQTLEAIGSNPFLPALVIQAKDPLNYKIISDYFKKEEFKDIVYEVDDYQRAFAIERLNDLAKGMNRMGMALTLFLSLIALIVTYNTSRLSIYSQKEEIEIMHLVGAKNSLVRGPFLVQGFLCGLSAAFLCFILFLESLFAFQSSFQNFFMGYNPFQFFISNILFIFLAQIFIGAGLGLLSSYFAVRRYLKD
ncbi:MAG: ABC transporter permease [Candidatus Paceibacterota bacterium]